MSPGRKTKTEHSGAKNDGAHWGTREEAKKILSVDDRDGIILSDELLNSLKTSIREVKKGNTKPMPSKWIED